MASIPASRVGILLTGGESKRMGAPKEWLDAGGVPLLARVLDGLLPVCPRCLVVARPGQRLPELPPGASRVDDPEGLAGGGPLVGVLAGLRAARAELVFLGSVDAPLLAAAHVEQVLGELERWPDRDAVIPVSHEGRERRLHPLGAALRAAPALLAAERLVGSGERRLKALFESLAAIELDASELVAPGCLASCNTREEWAALAARAGWR